MVEEYSVYFSPLGCGGGGGGGMMEIDRFMGSLFRGVLAFLILREVWVVFVKTHNVYISFYGKFSSNKNSDHMK